MYPFFTYLKRKKPPVFRRAAEGIPAAIYRPIIILEYIVSQLKIDPVIRDAVSVAIRKARLFSTNMAILKDGKVVVVTPDEFERGLSDNPQEPFQK